MKKPQLEAESKGLQVWRTEEWSVSFASVLSTGSAAYICARSILMHTSESHPSCTEDSPFVTLSRTVASTVLARPRGVQSRHAMQQVTAHKGGHSGLHGRRVDHPCEAVQAFYVRHSSPSELRAGPLSEPWRQPLWPQLQSSPRLLVSHVAGGPWSGFQ